MLCTALLVCSPLLAAAAQLDDVLQDVERLNDSLDSDAADLQLEQADREFAEQADIFPRNAIEEGGDVLLPDEIPAAEQTGSVSVQDGDAAVVLTDVPSDAWFAPYVRDMSAKQIISGYRDAQGKALGLFGPADNVTVEQLAKLAVLSANVDLSTCPASSINATATGSWSSSVVACAEMLRWTMYADGAVDVKRIATRREVVLTVLEAFRVTIRPATGTVFSDVPSTLEMRDAIETAAADGIVGGYTDTEGKPTGLFGPLDSVNRAETAKILSLAMQIYGK